MHTGVSMRKSEGKKALRKDRHRWKDNTEMNLQEVGWGHGLN